MLKKRKEKRTGEPDRQKPLRLWPGIVIVILQWLFRFVIPIVITDSTGTMIGFFGAILGGLAIILWWAFFSRAPWVERLGGVILMIIALIATPFILHESIGTGMQGMMFYAYALPLLSLLFVIWAAVSPRLSVGLRRALMIVTILLACGVWTLFRSEGITGEANANFAWRWTETYEEQLLARAKDELTAPPPVQTTAETGADWPGFRGPNRDGIIHGVRIKTDWAASPPAELWRRPVGPGCSSFSVRGSLLYTQEQRGEDEIVSCYNLLTGKPVWRHRDKARFWDSHAGAGPRGTPTLSNGRVYTLGATGILNVLNALDGSVVWSRNAATDADVKSTGWGFTSSPLVIEDLVIVAAAGKLAAYDRNTGEPRWFGPDGGAGFSSPHLATIDGVEQILLMSKAGVAGFTPAEGTLLWEHLWDEGRIVQPALTGDGDLLLSAGGTKGIRRLSITHDPEGWKIEERWTSLKMKPNFNDIIVHKGHVFGFNGPNLVCIDVEDGKRKWRSKRYGGQILLLADQDLLLLVTEKGELALVKAIPEKFTEVAGFPAIKGKTWNHPVLVGDLLVVRNSREMAAFRLPTFY